MDSLPPTAARRLLGFAFGGPWGDRARDHAPACLWLARQYAAAPHEDVLRAVFRLNKIFRLFPLEARA